MSKLKKISIVVDDFYFENNLFDKRVKDLNFFVKIKKFFRENGIEISTQDIISPNEADIIIYNDYRKKYQIIDKTHILLALESIAVKPNNFNKKNEIFDYVFTWKTSLVDNKRVFQIYYSYDLDYSKYYPFQKKNKFMCNITANKFSNHKKELYTERVKVLEFFKNYPDLFHLYGYGWDRPYKYPYIYKIFKFFNKNKISRLVSKALERAFILFGLEGLIYKKYSIYQGTIEDKLEVLKDYKFSLCFENVADEDTYITEKIFDCFKVGTVPIYLGSSNIKKIIPSNTFIDYRDFNDVEELFETLKSIDNKEFEIFQKNIKDYLDSDKINLFSSNDNAKFFVEKIIDNYNKSQDA